jgi:hypothetical protein
MKYRVLVTAEASVHTYVDVEAVNATIAEALALTDASANQLAYEWVLDDNQFEPYIADPGNCAEEVDA